MEAQGRRAVSRIIDILRKTTRLVQLLPFAYLVVYAAVLLTEPFIPDGLYCFIDALLNVPPAVVLLFLALSHLLKLCKWHKIACLIPMLSRVVNAFDGFVMTLTQSWDFYVTLNMMKADNCTMLRDWFPEAGADDMEGKLVEMAINWLNDGDNPYGGAKIWRYLNPAK